jgi:hypothetical protein
MRQFAEASAMAMLCADPTNGVFEKYQADRRHYPVHKSLDLVTTKRVAPSLQNLLGMDRERFQQFARDMRLFDHHSHASALSLSYLVMFTKRGGLVLGSQVDPTKRAARVKCREQTRPMPELTPTTPLQVAISKRAFNALDLERLRARLVAIGSARTRFEYNERHAGIGKVRLTCTVHIATGIIDELRVRAAAAEARHDSETLVACAEAVAAIFKAMEDERDRPAGPASHTRPAPN